MSKSRWRACPLVRARCFPIPGGPRAALLRRPDLPPGARRLPLPGGTGAPPEARLPYPGAARTNSVFERAMSLSLLIDGVQDQSHGAGKRLPFGLLANKLFASKRGEAIVPGALTFVGQIPGSPDPALRLQPGEGRVERTGLGLEKIIRGPLNVFRNCVTVPGSRSQGAQDQQVERALQELY